VKSSNYPVFVVALIIPSGQTSLLHCLVHALTASVWWTWGKTPQFDGQHIAFSGRENCTTSSHEACIHELGCKAATRSVAETDETPLSWDAAFTCCCEWQTNNCHNCHFVGIWLFSVTKETSHWQATFCFRNCVISAPCWVVRSAERFLCCC